MHCAFNAAFCSLTLAVSFNICVSRRAKSTLSYIGLDSQLIDMDSTGFTINQRGFNVIKVVASTWLKYKQVVRVCQSEKLT